MELAHVRAWPAIHTDRIDGWLWRLSGGGSQRANSVSTITFSGDSLDAAIDRVEAKYAAAGVAPRFHTFNDTMPSGLADRLMARGYKQTETTVTMVKRPASQAAEPMVERRDHAWDAWRAVYLAQITENRRLINARILDTIPAPAVFFAKHLDGQVAATALCSIDAGCAVVECVATLQAARRRGAARDVMRCLETWAADQGADTLGLQVVKNNTPAMRLYEGLGFVPSATNHFWVGGHQETP